MVFPTLANVTDCSTEMELIVMVWFYAPLPQAIFLFPVVAASVLFPGHFVSSNLPESILSDVPGITAS